MARRGNIWEQIWESTEGPTVTVTIPRDHAESLLKVLAASLEEEMPEDDMDDEGDLDDMDDLDFGDGDDMQGPPEEDDLDDLDDMGDADLDFMPAGDDDDEPAPKKKGPGRPPGAKNKDKGDDDDSDKDEDDDDDKKDESMEEDGFEPSNALGESAWSRALRVSAKARKRR